MAFFRKNTVIFVLTLLLGTLLTVASAAVPDSVIAGGETVGITVRSDGVIVTDEELQPDECTILSTVNSHIKSELPAVIDRINENSENGKP